MTEEIWDVCPMNWQKNFKCQLINTGLWRLEKSKTFGKWIFKIFPTEKPLAPTLADQRNFITGLLEAEWRNDNFVFPNGSNRNPQSKNKLEIFKRFLNDFEDRMGRKDIPNSIDFYVNKIKKERNL